MNKSQEIETLAIAIATLGKDSYVAPWLSEQLPYIESAMRSDLHISVRAMTLQELETHVSRIKSETESWVIATRQHAIAESGRIMDAAKEFARAAKAEAKSALRAIADKI